MNVARRRRNELGWRIIIVGTGGQGVLTAARLLCDSFVARGHDVVSGQLHGMAQRGGSVQSSVAIDSGLSPVIARGGAGYVVGLEPIETVRALPSISADTVVFMNTAPVIPFTIAQRVISKAEGAEYPEVEDLAERLRAVTASLFAFNGTQLAAEAGSAKTLNMIMLGCLLGFGALPCTSEEFWRMASRGIPPALAKTNARAFHRGVQLGEEFQTMRRGQ